MTDEIPRVEVEDLLPELQAASEETKSLKKMKVVAKKMADKVNGIFNKEIVSLRAKVKDANDIMTESLNANIEQINKFSKQMDEKYGQLYGYLVNKTILNLEKNVFDMTIYNEAMLKMMVNKFYHLEEHNFETMEEYIKHLASEHEALMQEIYDNKVAEINKQKEEDAKLAKENIQDGQVESESGDGSEASDSPAGEHASSVDREDGEEDKQESSAE